MVTSAGNKM